MRQESRNYRKYDRQFKEEAVRLVTDGGRQVTDAARRLWIHENLLHTWKRKYKEDPVGSLPGKCHLKPQEEALWKLQRENADLKEEREMPWLSSQNTPDEILVHVPASLQPWGAEDVPCNRDIKERRLQMKETASEQEAEGK